MTIEETIGEIEAAVLRGERPSEEINSRNDFLWTKWRDLTDTIGEDGKNRMCRSLADHYTKYILGKAQCVLQAASEDLAKCPQVCQEKQPKSFLEFAQAKASIEAACPSECVTALKTNAKSIERCMHASQEKWMGTGPFGYGEIYPEAKETLTWFCQHDTSFPSPF